MPYKTPSKKSRRNVRATSSPSKSSKPPFPPILPSPSASIAQWRRLSPVVHPESDDKKGLQRGTQSAVDRLLFNANYWRAAYEQRIVAACDKPEDALTCLQAVSVWTAHPLKLNTPLARRSCGHFRTLLPALRPEQPPRLPRNIAYRQRAAAGFPPRHRGGKRHRITVAIQKLQAILSAMENKDGHLRGARQQPLKGIDDHPARMVSAKSNRVG